MTIIANPVYDTVFKFLMEDNRVAKILLSALLQKEVVEVRMRQTEYTDSNRPKISMFRLDLAAKIREKDGKAKPENNSLILPPQTLNISKISQKQQFPSAVPKTAEENRQAPKFFFALTTGRGNSPATSRPPRQMWPPYSPQPTCVGSFPFPRQEHHTN